MRAGQVAKGETGALERSPAASSPATRSRSPRATRTAPGPLALVWAAALATGRPVGAFTPRARFHTLAYDGTAHHEPQRHTLADAAGRLGALAPDAHEAVRLLRPYEDKPLFCRPLRDTGTALCGTPAMVDLERHIASHEATILVLAPASELVAGGFTEGWGGYGLDAPSIARRLVISTRALAKRNRVAALVCHGDYAASRGFSDPAQLFGVSDALAGNASVVLSMAPPTPDDARARTERDAAHAEP